MKAKNDKEIYKKYGWFSFYLTVCVLIGICMYFFYLQTSQIEVSRVVEKTDEYDRIYVRQTEISNCIDSIPIHYSLLTIIKKTVENAEAFERMEKFISR